MSIREEIAKNLIKFRKEKGLTQKEIAIMLGINPAAVSNWESGRNSVDIENLLRLSKVLSVSLVDIYGIYADNCGFSDKEKELVRAYRKSPSMQSAVDKLLGISDEEQSYIFRAARSNDKSVPEFIPSEPDLKHTLENARESDEEL